MAVSILERFSSGKVSMNLRPLKWHWGEWTERFRRLEAQRRDILPEDVSGLITTISAWDHEMRKYLVNLSDDEKKDVIDLLVAETDMLFQTADPPDGYKPTEDDRLDFRVRFYEALPLLVLAERLNFPKADVARRCFRDLEMWVIEKRGWLP